MQVQMHVLICIAIATKPGHQMYIIESHTLTNIATCQIWKKLMHLNTHFPTAIRIWSTLPLHVVNATTLEIFKLGLQI